MTIGWHFDNTYSKLSKTFIEDIKPTPVHDPELVILNEQLAKELNLDFNTRKTVLNLATNNESIDDLNNMFEELIAEGNSVGAKLGVCVENCPVGLGEPVFDKLNADLAKAIMSINAVKGVNIGSGMNAAYLSGEENSDEIRKSSGKIKFKTNHAGGILGGISTGQDIVASFAVKPTSSILTSRETIDKKGKNTKISVKGRHDPCVGIRAVPIGEAMINCVLLDHLLMHRAQCG